jgi:hypothetical protein
MKLPLYLLAFLLLLSSACSQSTSTTDDDTNEPEVPTYNYKKGFGITVRSDNDWYRKLEELEVSWHYRWGIDLPDSMPAGVEFVPMTWGGNGIDAAVTKVNNFRDAIFIKNWNESRNLTTPIKPVRYLLGFNEPDGAEQANMTVARAITEWKKMVAVRVPLVSPAPIHPDAQWLKDFMHQADSLKLRVDHVAVHWYKGPNATQFLADMKKVYDLYKKPIWITEFGVADWNAKTPEQNRYTADQVLTFMRDVLPELDKLDYIYRYAWFNSSPDHAPLAPSALFDRNGELTTLGKYYKSFQ